MKDLSNRLSILLTRALTAGADKESIAIIKKFKAKIIEALRCYYKADIEKSNIIIKNLIKDIGNDSFAVSELNSSFAFPGTQDKELQLFRCRTGNASSSFSAKDMLHLPCSRRSKSGNYRFSIPGNPSLYLANSSYGCWIETGFPSDTDFCIDTLKSWLKAAGVHPGSAERENRDLRRLRELEAEVKTLRKQVTEKDEVIDVLKKSVGILYKP